MAGAKYEGSPRDRLLAAADDLFYEEGVHTVGIDRVIERAGVAKASLYSAFGSKEELVRAYLEARAERRRERITKRIAQYDDPRDRIFAVYDLLGEIAADPKYRGCAFLNATSEGPRDGTAARRACVTMRAWLRALFTELARAAGARDAELLGLRLAMLYDAAIVRASIELDPTAANEAREMAAMLLDAEVPAARKKTRPAAAPKRAVRGAAVTAK